MHSASIQAILVLLTHCALLQIIFTLSEY